MLSLVPLALYLVAAALLARAVRATPGARAPAALAAAAAGVLAHAWILFGAIRSERGVTIAITDSASLVGWVVGGSALVAMLWPELGALPAALLVLAGVLGSGTGLLSGFTEVSAPQWEVTAHILLAALAAGWLAIAAVVVLLLAVQDARLRERRPPGALALLPPMETMERTLFRALGGGFAVLTLALVTGLYFVHDLRSQHLLHKLTLTLVAWLVFAVLLWGRARSGWRGRKALRFTLAGFVALALAYFGSKFVLENLLGRHWG